MYHPRLLRLPFAFMIIYLIIYYSWILLFRNDEIFLTLGGNLLSVFACFIASFLLLRAARRIKQADRLFWLLMAAGMICGLLAEFVWLFTEDLLHLEVPFPGLPDVFYLLQYGLYLIAFCHKIWEERKDKQRFAFLFDILIIMIVATTFSWHFLIQPMVLAGHITSFTLGVSLAYPLGDLALLFGAFSLYYTKNWLSSPVVRLISVGLQIQIITDSIYLYLISIDGYHSGSWLDPIFMLANLFIGYAGWLQHTDGKYEETAAVPGQISIGKLAYPYISVVLLFAFMVGHSAQLDAVSFGAGMAIILVIAKQLFVIRENQKLLQEISLKADALEMSEQKYKSLFEHHPESVFSLDLEGRIQGANKASLDLLGYRQEELIGLASAALADSKDQTIVSSNIAQMKNGKPIAYEFTLRNKFGRFHYISMTNIPIMIKNKLVGIFGIGKDITAAKKNEERIHFLAYHDPLTGLANRILFEESLKKAISGNKSKFAILFLDLDNFKKVNDTLGHDIGDKLLHSVAQRIKACIRGSDIAARNGGDEFTIMLNPLINKEETDKLAKDILQSLRQTHLIDGYEIQSLPSIGISLYPEHGRTWTELMKCADKAMYEVKLNGKGNLRFYNQ
ncbi:DUF4084 domain-containing protein [Terribacillus saccharophilus]|uniref:DUF4084 domain-containing protein n=1 Tax=Terribacillus saccharophilus TaxID=361277 RepID=UPI003982B850